MMPINRDLFARLSDQIIPPTDRFPSPSAAGVHTSGLDRLSTVRPDLVAQLADAIAFCEEQSINDAFNLREADPARFRAVSASAAGIYLTEPAITAAFGYPGRPPLDVGDVDARVHEYEKLAAPVMDRGFVWASTPAVTPSP